VYKTTAGIRNNADSANSKFEGSTKFLIKLIMLPKSKNTDASRLKTLVVLSINSPFCV